ncbi:MAG: pyridoxal phosphate-dependent aminotransferase family protein [Flavobacteriales bacterium]|nr:pyridoxal phosphate-dependent aminotransferase family protein [Flavobacteriales bacterium]
MINIEQSLKVKLEKRKQENALRSLKAVSGIIDFSSNDYLGFARDFSMLEHSIGVGGSTGSRLLTGNSLEAEELESFIAKYHSAEAGLLYNSGYDANIGLLSCVPKRGDTVIYDELSHASIIDGIRLNSADSFKFRHNDIEHLESRLKSTSGNVFVVVESVYSMDGDFSPLQRLVELKQKFEFNLIVDEAHATGLFGEKGEGRSVELNIQDEVFARVHTYGKALGCHGAVVLGSNVLRDYLINFSRSFIYTTALPMSSINTIKLAYDKLGKIYFNNLLYSSLVKLFKVKVKVLNLKGSISSSSPIQTIIVPGNDKVTQVAKGLQKSLFDVRPILSPTVPKGKERLRICLHEFNTPSEVESLITVLERLL